jgi:hypothetical protein
MNNKPLITIRDIAESGLNAAYHLLHRLKHHQMEELGLFGLIFLPVIDFIKFVHYCYKSSQNDYKKFNNPEHKWGTRLLYFAKFAATTSGVVLALLGLASLGLNIIFLGNAVMSIRSFVKATAAYFIDENPEKARKNVIKGIVSAGYTAAFAMMLVFPPAPIIALSLALVAVSIQMVYSLWWGKAEKENVEVAVVEAVEQPEVIVEQEELPAPHLLLHDIESGVAFRNTLLTNQNRHHDDAIVGQYSYQSPARRNSI